MTISRRSFIGVVLGVAASTALPPLVAVAAVPEVDVREPFVGFMHLEGGETLPFGKISMRDDHSWWSEPYVATEKFTVVAWSLYVRGSLLVDRQPRPRSITLRPGDTITLDLDPEWNTALLNEA